MLTKVQPFLIANVESEWRMDDFGWILPGIWNEVNGNKGLRLPNKIGENLLLEITTFSKDNLSEIREEIQCNKVL